MIPILPSTGAVNADSTQTGRRRLVKDPADIIPPVLYKPTIFWDSSLGLLDLDNLGIVEPNTT